MQPTDANGDAPGASAPGPSRRSWARRAARGFAALALASLLLVVTLVGLLYTPVGHDLVRRGLEAWGSRAIGGTLRLAELELRPLSGRARLGALSVAVPGVTLDVQRIEIDWSPRSGPHLRVLGPHVIARADAGLERDEAPATGLAAQPWRALERLGLLELRQGRLELRDEARAQQVVFDGVELEGARGGRVTLRIRDASISLPDATRGPASLEATLRLDGSTLVIESARVNAGASTLDLRGRLERVLPTTATFAARASVDGGSVGAFVPQVALAGPLVADAEIQVANDILSGALRAETPALSLQGVGPWDLRTLARFEGGKLVIESLTARGFAGLVELTGDVTLATPTAADLHARIDGIDPAALAKAVSGESLPLAARVSGSLRVTTTGGLAAARGDGRLTLAPAAGPGLKASGGASLRFEGQALSLDARVETVAARATASVSLEGKASLRGRWNAELDVASLPALAAELGRAAPAALSAQGRLRAEGELGGALSEPVVSARVSSQALSVRGSPLALEAQVRYGSGRLSLAPLVLRAGGGQATFSGRVPLRPTDAWDVAGEIDALDLAPALALAGLDGEGPLGGMLHVQGPRDAPVSQASLHARATLRRPAAAAAAGSLAGNPAGPADVTVAVAVEARSRGHKLEVERIEAEVAGGRAWGSGRYDAASDEVALTLTAQGLDWPRLPLLPKWAEALTGTLSGEVQLAGSTSTPTGQLRISLDEPRVRDHELPPVSLEAHFDGRELRVGGKADAVFLRGHAALEGDWPLRLEIDLHALPLQPLLEALPAAREANATIDASGTLVLELPLREPSRLRYSSTDLALAGRVRDLEWRVPPFALRGDRESLELDGPRLETGGAWLGAQGRVALQAASPFDLRVQGQLDLAALDRALPDAGLGGSLELRLQVSGTQASPELDGTLAVSGAHGRVAGVPWDGLDLAARFAAGQVQLETLRADFLGGALAASGSFPIDRRAGAGTLRFELRDVDLARLAAPDASRASKPHALFVSLAGELRATEPSVEGVAGGGHLTRLEALTTGGSLGLAAPAEWSLAAGRLELGGVRLAGPLGALEARAEAHLAAPIGFSATVSGAADLSVLDPFLEGATLAGPARLDLHIASTPSGLRVDGGVVVEKARVSLEQLQFVATDLGGELRFDGERMRVEATALAGDGTLRLHGGMRLGPALLGPAELQLEAGRVPIQYPPGFRGRATGTLTLAGDPGRYRLSGAIGLDQGYFAGQLDARDQALDRLAWQLAALDGGPLKHVSLDVRLRLTQPLRIRNSRMQLDAEGTVQAGGTLAQPTTGGHVTLLDGGELTLGRARVSVTGGRIELNNHPAGTPEVDFQGHARVSGVAMEIRARGPLDDLELTLSSDQPELTQADLVALLLTGRTANAAASQGGTVVAEQLAMALGGVLQRGVGESLLIDVSPERSLLSDDTDPTQRFNIGTRVAQNVSVIYSAALDGTGQRWIVELNPGGGRFRFRAITEEDNSFSFEATARQSFDLWSRGRRAPSAARERERLAGLRFEGTLPVPERELAGAARLRAGRRYSWLQREQAADRVEARLVREGYRQASVGASSLPAATGVELVLRVEAGPRVAIQWRGDDAGRRARQDAERAWLTFSTPEAAASAVARTARWRLQSRGFHAARVEPKVIPSEGRLDVILQVTLGARGNGVELAFEGNTVLADAALAAGLPPPGSFDFFEMLDARSTRISSEVRLAYAGIGHLQARVVSVSSAHDAASGRLRVTVAVSEGEASPVLELVLPAEAGDSGGPSLRLAVGQPFDIAAYTADRQALAAWYRGQGFIDAEVRAALEPEEGGVRVRFLVDPGPRPRVGETRIAQAGRTRNSLIERSLTLREGDPVKPDALAESRERLWELGLFRSVDVRAEPRPGDDEVRDVLVSLADRPDVAVEYGLRYTTAGQGGAAGGPPSTPEGGQVQVAGAVELNNPLGFGMRARVYGSATLERQSWGVNLDAATLAGRRVRTQLFVFDDDDDHRSITGLASHVRGVSLQQSRVLLRDRRSRRWHDRLRLQWGYVFKDIEYATQAEDTLLLQGDRGFLSLGAIGDERDSLTDPKRGVFWTANTELARTGLGSDVDYVRLYGQLFAYVPIGRLVWAQGFRFGSVPGDNPLLLLENRFFAGGPTTVRGFEQNGLGAATLEGDSIGGQAVAILNQELRFPIWRSLQGGVFWDAGNSWLTSEAFDLGDLRQSVGFGLRYVFPFGPIRVEYAWIVGRRPGEPKGRFVFGLGHAF